VIVRMDSRFVVCVMNLSSTSFRARYRDDEEALVSIAIVCAASIVHVGCCDGS
jgi:hypothetical protein